MLAAAERALQKCNNQHTRADDLTRALAPERRRFEGENFTNCGGNAGCLVQGIVGLRWAVPGHAASMRIAMAREIACVAAAQV